MSLAERWKAALEQNQENWKSRISKEEPVRELLKNRKSLECRRFELEKAVNEWQRRSTSPFNDKNDKNEIGNCEKSDRRLLALIYKDGGGVVRRHSPLIIESCRNCYSELINDENLAKRSAPSSKTDEKFSNVIVNNPLTKVKALSPTIEERNLLKNPKRPAPARRLTNRRISMNPKQHVFTEKTLSVSYKLECQETEMKREKKKVFVLGEEFNESIDNKNKLSDRFLNVSPSISFKLPADAFQTPIIGVEHCGVKLRQVDTASAFPEVMLIQFQGIRSLNVRLVCPKLSSQKLERSMGFGSYLLITRNQLIIWNAEDASVFEKSKPSQMAYEILAGKELSCLASKVEIANDDCSIMNVFKQIVSNNENSSIDTLNLSKFGKDVENVADLNRSNIDNTVGIEMSYQEAREFYTDDVVYLVTNEGEIEEISRAESPSSKHLDSSKILIFDFITEIYVWIGQNANRFLITKAVKHAETLQSHIFTARQNLTFGVDPKDKDLDNRPAWTILRKQTQGIFDCLFRFKFEDFYKRIAQLNNKVVKTHFTTPNLINTFTNDFENRVQSISTGFSVYNQSSNSAMINRISSLCANDAYFGILKNEKILIDDLATELGSRPDPKLQPLRLEGVDLHVTDENVFTEKLIFYRLANEENLERLEKPLLELDNSSCYVVEWHYRIEKEGIHRLNGDRIAVHETGRQRVAYFYWLSEHSSVKDRSRCALALRNFDKNRHEHIRIESGNEPPVFLNLLGGKMIVSGTESGWFVIIGSSGKLFSAEELPEPIEFRSQGVYLQIDKSLNNRVICWRGSDASEDLLKGALSLGAQLALGRHFEFDLSAKELNTEALKILKFNSKNCQDTKLLHPEKWNGTAPRLYRLYGNEGDELMFERYDKGINFTFHQSDLRDCVLVDQGTHLWIWSETVVKTFELEVADKLWHEIKGKPRDEDSATVIVKGYEPHEFKALFVNWINEEEDDSTKDNGKQTTPISLKALLHKRTQFRTAEELRTRKLPKGCDTKHLERYLNDLEFQQIFKCSKCEYDKLPRWKQISLKKEANLF